MPCTPFSGIGFRSFVLRLGNAANPDALHAFPFGGTGSAQDRAAPQPLNRQTHQRHNDATGNLSRWFQSTVPLHPRLWSPPVSIGFAVLPALGILCLIASPSPADLRPASRSTRSHTHSNNRPTGKRHKRPRAVIQQVSRGLPTTGVQRD